VAQRAPQIKAAKQELEDLGDVINAIYAAPASAATPEQKRQALDRAYERMVDVARQVVAASGVVAAIVGLVIAWKVHP
jgi:hypothetical protein